MIGRTLLFIIALAFGTPAVAGAQSLAAVAESGRGTESATRIYTNDDLLADGGASMPEASAPASTDAETPVDIPPAAAKRTIVEENVGAGSVNLIVKPEKSASAENEPFWRKVTKSVKDRLTTAENELATIDARMESADPRERERLMTLRAKVQRDIELVNAEFAGHQKRAQALGVPADWLR